MTDTTLILGRAGVPSLDDFLSFVRLNNLARQERFFAGIAMPGISNGPYLNSDLQVLNLLCEQASLPGKTINVRTLRVNGINEYRAGTIDYGGESITLQFLVDGSYRVRDIMEKWMNRCVSTDTPSRNEVEFYRNYAGTITLHALMPAGIPGEALFNWSPTQADVGLNSALNNLRNKNRALGILATKATQIGLNKVNEAVTRAKSGLARNIPPEALEAFRDTENTVFGVQLHDCWPRSMNVMPLGYDAVGVARLTMTFTYRHWTSEVKGADTFDVRATNSLNNNNVTQGLSTFLNKTQQRTPNE